MQTTEHWHRHAGSQKDPTLKVWAEGRGYWECESSLLAEVGAIVESAASFANEEPQRALFCRGRKESLPSRMLGAARCRSAELHTPGTSLGDTSKPISGIPAPNSLGTLLTESINHLRHLLTCR